MRNMFLCAMILLSVAVQSFSQRSTSQDLLHVTVYDKEGKVENRKVLRGDETNEIDLERYINQHITKSRVAVYGHFTTNGTVSYVSFDSKNVDEGNLCKQEELKLKPSFGISGCSNENFSGFIVESVASESSAANLGLVKGDVLYSLNGKEITTYCDLSMTVRTFQIGETVSVEYSKKGRIVNGDAVISGKGYKKVSFHNCEVAVEAPSNNGGDDELFKANLNLYPNPSRGTTFLKYESDSNEDVSYYLVDTNGALVYQKDVEIFTGSFRTSFDFKNLPAGTYYFVVEQGKVTTKQKILFVGN